MNFTNPNEFSPSVGTAWIHTLLIFFFPVNEFVACIIIGTSAFCSSILCQSLKHEMALF
jgi:hypothetical protein